MSSAAAAAVLLSQSENIRGWIVSALTMQSSLHESDTERRRTNTLNFNIFKTHLTSRRGYVRVFICWLHRRFFAGSWKLLGLRVSSILFCEATVDWTMDTILGRTRLSWWLKTEKKEVCVNCGDSDYQTRSPSTRHTRKRKVVQCRSPGIARWSYYRLRLRRFGHRAWDRHNDSTTTYQLDNDVLCQWHNDLTWKIRSHLSLLSLILISSWCLPGPGCP